MEIWYNIQGGATATRHSMVTLPLKSSDLRATLCMCWRLDWILVTKDTA